LFVLTAASLHPVAAQQQKTDLENVLSLFPGFHILKLAERDADTRAFLVSHFPKDSPSVMRGDFDGDGVDDYALLLKNNKSGLTKVVVALCGPDKQCRSIYRLDVSSDAGVVYLRPSRIGSTSVGVQVIYFEKGKVLLSWNKKLKRIEEVPAGD
jgi:hypothetical protein